jgi:hypothetical protein
VPARRRPGCAGAESSRSQASPWEQEPGTRPARASAGGFVRRPEAMAGAGDNEPERRPRTATDSIRPRARGASDQELVPRGCSINRAVRPAGAPKRVRISSATLGVRVAPPRSRRRPPPPSAPLVPRAQRPRPIENRDAIRLLRLIHQVRRQDHRRPRAHEGGADSRRSPGAPRGRPVPVEGRTSGPCSIAFGQTARRRSPPERRARSPRRSARRTRRHLRDPLSSLAPCNRRSSRMAQVLVTVCGSRLGDWKHAQAAAHRVRLQSATSWPHMAAGFRSAG